MNWNITIRHVRSAALTSLLVILLGWVSPTLAATPDEAPPIGAGQARIWFLRQLIPGSAFAAPMIYANGTAIAISSEGTAFYHDFPPGDYVFSVENCTPAPQTSFTLTLNPGSLFALQVQSDDFDASACDPPQISSLRPVAPEMVASLFAQVAYLGAR
jgi:hypothetical protein